MPLPSWRSNQSPETGYSMSRKMMKKLMLSCKTATGLMEKKHLERLSIRERIQLAFHTTLCDACRRYEQQSRLLERLFKSKAAGPVSPGLKKESAELEEKILQQLDAHKQ